MGLFGFRSKTGQQASTKLDIRTDLKRPGGRILRICWLGLKTADIMQEITFLEKVLRLRYIDEGNSAVAHHVRYNCGGLELELLTGGTAWATRPKPRHGQPDIPLVPSFGVDNIQTISKNLSEQEVLSTQIYEQGWAASILFFDPERNLWQVNETRTEPAIGTEEPLNITTLWLAVEDFPAQVGFYRDVLGLPLEDEAVRPRPITLDAEQYQAENPLAVPLNLHPDFEIGPADDTSEETKPVDSLTSGAVFFSNGTRLALSPGGKKLEDEAERVWGRDTAFMPGFETDNLEKLIERLKAAGVRVSAPFAVSSSPGRNHSSGYAVRFVDPEGNYWQVFG